MKVNAFCDKYQLHYFPADLTEMPAGSVILQNSCNKIFGIFFLSFKSSFHYL
jgi:hypothetical protein